VSNRNSDAVMKRSAFL